VEAYEKAIAESLQNGEELRAQPLEGQRASMACAACAKIKTKCDQQNPCGRCQAKGLTCTPRTKKRAPLEICTLEDDSLPDSEMVSGQDPDDGILELATSVTGRDITQQDGSATISDADEDSGLDIEFAPGSVQISHQIPANDKSANQPMTDHATDQNQPAPAIFSNFMPTDSMPPAYSVQSAERYWGVSRLPQLDWQSLTSNPITSQYPNLAPTPNQDGTETNAFQNSHLGGFDDFQGYSGIEAEQPTLNTELLFSFNVEDNAWETRLSALNSIMGDCFQPNQPAPSVGLNTLPSDPDRVQNEIPGGSSLEAQNWSPQDVLISTDLVLDDEDLDGWAFGQCIKHSDTATTYSSPVDPQTRQGYQDFTTWSHAVERYRDSCFEPHERIENVDLTDETRDWMLIAIQQFLRTGMESQDAQKLSKLLEGPPGAAVHSSERFLLLPPKTSLQKYLDIFLTTFEPFTPMIPALSLNPNKLASRSRERDATLLLFLMIAFGSMIDPAPRARQFSYELTEVCRHSLKKITDSGGVTKQDTLALHCALIFTCLTSYSGRKSHMDTGNTYRHLYLAVSNHLNFSCSSWLENS
jgi:hypothetical protein